MVVVPSGSVYTKPSQIASFNNISYTGNSVKLTNTILSLPSAAISVISYSPSSVTIVPSGKVKLSPSQIAVSIVVAHGSTIIVSVNR